MTNEKKIRRAQTIQPFGIGSILDIDGEAFVVKDISSWKRPKKPIKLERLEKSLNFKKLWSFSDFENEEESFPVTRFPKWYHCPKCDNLQQIFANNQGLQQKRGPTCNNCSGSAKLSPMRFIAYCNNGHLTDIDWYRFAHLGSQQADSGYCSDKSKIFFESTGRHGGDFDQMTVKCKACDAKKQPLSKLSYNIPRNVVYAIEGQQCCGTQPWLVGGWMSPEEINSIAEECSEEMKREPRGSTSLYRPKIISALDINIETESVADFDTELIDALIEHIIEEEKSIQMAINELEAVDNIYATKIESTAQIAKATFDNAIDYILKDLKQRLESTSTIDNNNETSIPNPQEILFKDELDFFRKRIPVDQANFSINFESTKKGNKFLSSLFSSIAKIRRLREIRAFTGFTRGRGFKEVPVDIGEKRDWLPVIEAFGEGIYFELNTETIKKYFAANLNDLDRLTKNQKEVLNRLKENYILDIDDSTLFILTHTLSHLLIRQLTFNSGYSSSALRERVYVDSDSHYAGIMVYTSELDSEGTMGGLVDQARIESISLILDSLIESAIWCSADPVCRETESQGFSGINTSACHCCSLISETSCTFQNAMLNRLTLGGLGVDRGTEVLGLFNYIRNET